MYILIDLGYMKRPKYYHHPTSLHISFNYKPADDQSRCILLIDRLNTTRCHSSCLLKNENCSELLWRLSGAYGVLLYELGPLLLVFYMLSHVSVGLGSGVILCQARRTAVSDDVLKKEIDQHNIYCNIYHILLSTQ